MDIKTCGFLSHVPTRFQFGWDEEATLCIHMKQVILQQIQLLRREGYRDGTWVLLDYGCICVHVFSQEAREFYGLERLWRDGRPLDLSSVLTAD